MKRREFIRFIAAASAVPAFSVARAQEAGRSRRIGILADAAISADPRGRAFFEELAAGGFVEGANLQVDHRGNPACGDGRDCDPDAALRHRRFL